MITDSIARRNPYIIGRPIGEEELLFGRENIFHFIEDNLTLGVKVIFLSGQRRIGLSSIIRNIPKYVASEEFVFVNFDIQEHSQEPFSTLLHSLITDIITNLNIDPQNITLPLEFELKTEAELFYPQLLCQIYEQLGYKKLVLVLKEFDTINYKNSHSEIERLCCYLHSLIKLQDKLFIIFVARGELTNKSYLCNLFQNAPSQEVGLLDEESAKQLIIKPAEGILEYDEDAVREILQLSAGHPYFIQVICFTLFIQARIENNWKVTAADVEAIVDKAIKSAEAGLAWLWDGISIPERVVFSAVANAQEVTFVNKQPFPELALKLLKELGVSETDDLIQSATKLANKGFLDHTQRIVKGELIRRWVVKYHPLNKEILELKNLDREIVNPLYEEAKRLEQEGKNLDAIEIYKQILSLNPNHFITLPHLAEVYLKIENFDAALQLYKRAYKIDKINHQDRYLLALKTYGNYLIEKRKFTLAKKQFEKVLEIESENILAQKKLQEINIDYSQWKHQQITLGATVAVLVAALGLLLLGGIGIYKWSTPCVLGQRKVNGIFCVADTVNISRGERTLFPTNINPSRDQGIAEFKQGNYEQAANDFAQAVQYNPNDPELLIYYNNALARQRKDSPLTFAVVVPVDNRQSIAQEMLRGVALAQNQFNANGGMNSRFLEIVIANDANDTEQAKKVAQQLVNNKSVLAVIGHSTSQATRSALDEYKKSEESLAIISPTNTSNRLQDNIFFRTVPSNVKVAQELAKYIRNQLNLTKVVIFYNPGGSYSESLREEFTHKFEQQGGQVVQKIDLTELKPNADQKLNESVSKYQAQAALLFPDAQYIAAALDIVKAKANSKKSKVQNLYLLGSAILYNNQTLKEDKNVIEGLILSVPWFREAQQSQDFANKAAKQWEGEISWRTATSYDATQALIQALSSNPSRATVLQRLRQVNLSPAETSGNKLEFTQEGEIQTQPLLIQVKDGKFEILEN